jgi:glycosyltransferase involved in cell wall biosynthesis
MGVIKRHGHLFDRVWLSLLAYLVKPIPFVLTIHDVSIHPGDTSSQRIPRVFVRLLVKLSSAVVVHGDALRAEAVRELPINLDRVFIFPHPPLGRYFELTQQQGFARPTDGLFRVLFFGRIHEYKGLRYLIEAAPLVHEQLPNLRVIIAGKGDDFSSYRSLIEDSSYFEIHNRFISELDAARMFAEADLLVLPYIEASQSGVLMIAMCFGLPVVATTVGEIAQVVREAGMGTVVRPQDKVALAAAIIEMATNALLRNGCRRATEEKLRNEFSRHSLSSRALAIYEQVLGLDKSPVIKLDGSSNDPVRPDPGMRVGR